MLPLPSDTDLPPASVTEIASILANGYARYRASLRRSPQGQPDGAQAQPPAANAGLAFPATPSLHVSVVNAQRKGEKGRKGEQR
jgi:hypothetical protein